MHKALSKLIFCALGDSFAAYWTWLEASMPLYESWAGSGFAEKPADFERARPATVRHPDPPPSRIDPQASEPTTWTTTPSGETAPPRVPPIPPRAGAPKDGWKVW